MNKIKIIEAVNQLGLGGTEHTLQLFSKFLNKEYFEVTVVGLKEGGARVELIENMGIKVILLNGDLTNLGEILRGADVFHLHSNGLLDHELFSIIQENKPKLVIQTNVFGLYDKESPFYDLVDYDLYVSRMILVRRMNEDKELATNFSEKRKVLYNPVDTSRIKSLLPAAEQIVAFKEENKLQDAFIVGRIGRADDIKFDMITLDGFAEFAASVKQAKFLLVGATPGMLAHAASLGISDKLIVIENTPDLKQLLVYYKSIDVFLAASEIGESFGMVISEAMMVGTPVVTINTEKRDNAQIEVVDNHSTGLVAKRHKKDIGNALRYLYKRPQLRAKYSVASTQKVIEQYEVSKLTKSLELLIFKHFGLPGYAQEQTLPEDFSKKMVNAYVKRCADIHGRLWIVKKLLYLVKRRRYI